MQFTYGMYMTSVRGRTHLAQRQRFQFFTFNIFHIPLIHLTFQRVIITYLDLLKRILEARKYRRPGKISGVCTAACSQPKVFSSRIESVVNHLCRCIEPESRFIQCNDALLLVCIFILLIESISGCIFTSCLTLTWSFSNTPIIGKSQ